MNFIDKFIAYIGTTECPTAYLRWAAISLVAACLGDRIYLEKPAGSRRLKVYPNLYVLLLGPTGNWKSFAANAAGELLHCTDHAEVLNLYQGKITAPAMYDAMFMGMPGSEYYRPWASRIYLLNDELSNDFGMPDMADLMLRSLTELFTPDKPFTDRTRGNSSITLSEYIVNWLACTTEPWLLDRVSLDMLEGGFFGRLCIADAGYSKRRIFEDDAASVSSVSKSVLVEQLDRLLHLQEAFPRSQAARAYEREWFYSREVPLEGDPLRGIWQREALLVNKLELVLAAAEDSHGIELAHAEAAITLLPKSSQAVARLVQKRRLRGR